MIIEKYGITLIRLQKADLELVRKMRNKAEISSKMFFQKRISKKDQQEWFKKINTAHHYYFVIKYKDKKIGLIHGKVHSYKNKTAEGGMFIWDETYQNSHLPVIASICLADITFLIMGMHLTMAEVRKDNTKAIAYNLKLGYSITEEIEDEQKVKMELTKKAYLEKASLLRLTVKKLTGETKDISWDDVSLSKQDMEELYPKLPVYLKKVIDKKRSHGE
ncbi:GNAT family N-acetyltransferase [Mesonia aquimarina]|uniref:GNAT family N-acetyltransferase n=1 Tax=Mesonia aquimarina TaxID=1504967 RepID=UPI000EF57D7E|nr:GNAT family N-acetyltransferase [Mesonia aquimarina]